MFFRAVAKTMPKKGGPRRGRPCWIPAKIVPCLRKKHADIFLKIVVPFLVPVTLCSVRSEAHRVSCKIQEQSMSDILMSLHRLNRFSRNLGMDCTDRMCGAYDCNTCYPGSGYNDEEGAPGEVSTIKLVTAKKPRYAKWGERFEIKPGDLVEVRSGFHYLAGGPRTGYFRYYTRVQKGPAWF